MKSGLPYEFRTTVVPGLLKKEDFHEMEKLFKELINGIYKLLNLTQI
jgi:pyruvate-formate lyase-activating enzyme